MAHDKKQHDNAMLDELRAIRALLERIVHGSHCSVTGQDTEANRKAQEELLRQKWPIEDVEIT